MLARRWILSGVACAMALTALSTAQAHMSEEHHDAFTEEHMNARIEQHQYFQKMQDDLRMGKIVDISNSCKYVSYIFKGAVPRVVALTFDDGPSASSTPIVLSTLRKHGIKATFFIKGDNGTKNSKVISQIVNEGHLVANHSWSHPNFHTLSNQNQINQITSTDNVLNHNRSSMRLFRYPYGNSTCFGNNFLRKNGYHGIVGWHVDSCDWAYANSGYVTEKQARICGVSSGNRGNFSEHVVSSIQKRDGGIVLFHDIHRRTAESLDAIIIRLQRQGYKFSNLDDPRMAAYF